MKIKNTTVYVYDIEVFPNVFHNTVKDTETNQLYTFEISIRKNQIKELLNFYKDKNKIFCGYNNKHYDDAIINYMIDYQNAMLYANFDTICRSIYKLSSIIVSKDKDTSLWKKWKYAHFFKSFDLLTMLYSNKLRVGLKEMQVTMQYSNVQELNGNFTECLLEKDIDEMIKYNINDVESTIVLLYKCQKDIDLRINIEKEYGIECLSMDGMTLGMEIIKQKYLEKTGISKYVLENMRSPMDLIPLKDVILPFISYNTPILQNILQEMKQQTVSPDRKGYENKFFYANREFSVGVGGIHTINKPECVETEQDEMMIDIDVASLYPSLLLKYHFYPKHLGEEFEEVYSQIKKERIEAKRNGDKVKNLTLKLALNGLSGNLQNKYSFCYSPFAAMQIRINGQLLLLMLTEKLVNINCQIIQANTDGLFIKFKRADYNKVKQTYNTWETLTGLELEEERYESMYQYNVNGYVATKEGYKETKNKDLIKEKGMFITKVVLGKGMSAKIIPEAVERYLIDKIPIEETIYNCKDINKFITYQKVDKKFQVEYNNKPIQRINRFYASRFAPYLLKYKYENGIKMYTNLLTQSGVILINKLDETIPIEDRKINYGYYLTEAKKIIEEIKPRQVSLW